MKEILMNDLLVTHPTTCKTLIAHINIWDDYSEEIKFSFRDKHYHTYAYIEQIVQFEQLNGCEIVINDEVATIILSHFRSLLIENNIFPNQNCLFIILMLMNSFVRIIQIYTRTKSKSKLMTITLTFQYLYSVSSSSIYYLEK